MASESGSGNGYEEISTGVSKMIRKKGTGSCIEAGDQITVHCTMLLDLKAKKFWSTKDPGQQPFTFVAGVGQVIAGWDEAVVTMRLKELSKIKIDQSKGYAESGFPAWGIPPNADLLAELEVLEIKRAKKK